MEQVVVEQEQLVHQQKQVLHQVVQVEQDFKYQSTELQHIMLVVAVVEYGKP
jgi:hypothetical protein